MAIVLGIKGREWAWQAKRWDSVEHFNKVQRRWSIVGVIILISVFLILFLIIFVAINPMQRVQEAEERERQLQEFKQTYGIP